ncbi:MAG: hypothetical protein NG737_03190 [Omnitrophica bacterium]|nr:hypothetical protein [Candidatus Omnitrophota bacterium]
MLFNKRSRKAINLVELIIVIVIAGILLTFAVPAFINAQLKIKDKEAQANLKILQAAAKNFGIDNDGYGPGGRLCEGTAACNAELGTDIPIGQWHYRVDIDSGTFCIDADKVNDSTESWHIGEFNETVQDCRCGGDDRCTNR